MWVKFLRVNLTKRRFFGHNTLLLTVCAVGCTGAPIADGGIDAQMRDSSAIVAVDVLDVSLSDDLPAADAQLSDSAVDVVNDLSFDALMDGRTDAAADSGDRCAVARPTIRRRCAGDWEVCFEGNALPGQGSNPYDAWDNPVDDDWHLQSFRLAEVLIDQREGARTYVRSARTAVDGPMWLYRRDQHITYETGMEMAVGIRVPRTSDDNAVFIQYIDAQGGFALIVNGASLVFNPAPNYNPQPRAVSVALPPALQGQFLDLVLRKLPQSSTVQILAQWPAGDGSFNTVQPFAVPLAAQPFARGPDYPTRWTIGDNNDNAHGQYDLDYVRVRRHRASTPIDPCGASIALPLPGRQMNDRHFFGGVGSDSAVLSVAGVREAWASVAMTGMRCGMEVPPPPDRSVRRLRGAGATGAILCVYDNRLGFTQGFAIEARFRRAGAPVIAGHLSWIEPANGHTIRFEADALVAQTYGKPVSQGRYATMLAMGDWHVVRAVRPASSLYTYVYLDGAGSPVISDWNASDAPDQDNPVTQRWAQLVLGSTTMPTTATEAWAAPGMLAGVGSAAGAIEVDYVRWSTTALAP